MPKNATLLIAASSLNGLMVPNWRISTTNSLCQWAQLPISCTTVMDGGTHSFEFSNADFLEISMKTWLVSPRPRLHPAAHPNPSRKKNTTASVIPANGKKWRTVWLTFKSHRWNHDCCPSGWFPNLCHSSESSFKNDNIVRSTRRVLMLDLLD